MPNTDKYVFQKQVLRRTAVNYRITHAKSAPLDTAGLKARHEPARGLSRANTPEYVFGAYSRHIPNVFRTRLRTRPCPEDTRHPARDFPSLARRLRSAYHAPAVSSATVRERPTPSCSGSTPENRPKAAKTGHGAFFRVLPRLSAGPSPFAFFRVFRGPLYLRPSASVSSPPRRGAPLPWDPAPVLP